ncbi:hypothetical protein HDU88_008408 [Geranomyces variabilis]|nr:hypothetical protein HDU88_008408 [Geranomyces variabilis]
MEIEKDISALWRRKKIIFFDLKFVASPRPECLKEKLINLNLDTQMDSWPGKFLLLLMEIYREHIGTGQQLNELAEVTANVTEHKVENKRFEQHLRTDNNKLNLRGPPTKDIIKQLKGMNLDVLEKTVRIKGGCLCNNAGRVLTGWTLKDPE